MAGRDFEQWFAWYNREHSAAAFPATAAFISGIMQALDGGYRAGFGNRVVGQVKSPIIDMSLYFYIHRYQNFKITGLVRWSAVHSPFHILLFCSERFKESFS